jgi:hypothetical protein
MVDVEMSLCWMRFHDLSIYTFATLCEFRALVSWRFGGVIVFDILILISNLGNEIVCHGSSVALKSRHLGTEQA